MNDSDLYVPFTQIAGKLPISKGDILYVVSDVLDLAKSCRDNGERFECDKFIVSLQEAVGDCGTLMFPTFNWDFCKGIAFDYRSTKGKTGVLGNTALKMQGFKRTRHPLYSFAVWGRDKETLVQMDNVSSFAENSPFAYMREKRARTFVMGLSSLRHNSFVHYIEQSLGVEYRFEKEFTALYIDSTGNASERTYTMYVRYLERNVQYVPQPMERIIDQLGINRSCSINGAVYHLTDVNGLYEVAKLDFQYNRAKNMFHY